MAAHENILQYSKDPSPTCPLCNRKKRKINFGNDIKHYSHATSTAVQTTLNPRPDVGIPQHVLTIVDGQRVIARMHVCET